MMGFGLSMGAQAGVSLLDSIMGGPMHRSLGQFHQQAVSALGMTNGYGDLSGLLNAYRPPLSGKEQRLADMEPRIEKLERYFLRTKSIA